MHLAKREWRQIGRWRVLVSAVAFGLLLGVTGPFGSQTTLTTNVKYAMWMVISLAGFGAAVAAERMLPSAQPGKSRWRQLIAVALASAVPMTFFVAWAFGVARPGRSFSPLQILGLFPYVALVQLVIARIIAPDEPVILALPSEQSTTPPEFPRAFLAKLPPALRRDILALEAEDHYVRVHTLQGTALVLMRLADAVAAIDPSLGLRVHRSWWVAKNGVRALETTPGRAIIRLLDDTAVPVSRTYQPAVRTVLYR